MLNMGEMHVKRWLTGIIGIPILIFLIGFGPRWLFYILLCAAALVGLWEYFRITAPGLSPFVKWINSALVIALFFAVYMRQALLLPGIMVLWAFFPMALEVFTFSATNENETATSSMTALLGPVYTALPLALLMFIDMRPQGHLWIFFLLTVVFACDTGAFYFGRSFGKHKLHKRVSPGKTWEGAAGGLFSSLLTAMLFLKFIDLHPFNVSLVLMVVTLAIASQIGDLAESVLKRKQGVKDSGSILPGHGGILDRIDGLLFAIPVLFFYLNI
ncbi:MAG: phosphatidate cytidylyltransferase [Deltaproteobacteria bacterium]|nr:phosphatidate cytidylyltransferase [Deltaproteobacteria bacterium]